MKELMPLHDEELFFQIVQSTPDLIEAMDMCRRGVHAVRRVQLVAKADGDAEVDFNCARTVERLRNEITYIGMIYDQVQLRRGIKEVLGIDALKEVEEWCAEFTEMKLKEGIQRDAGKNSAKPLSSYSGERK
ncbi:UNVERIFIED_CONTAM: UPF0262 family protein [Pseudomonas aeruginosa]|uniref:UPF0262 family protein n=1 Tax=Pseudomonas aeruginosa TaxID=287 RepID=UPI001A1F6AD2|nr:UPF0262 family protein [Pseudomonas aeruginosa]MBG7513344.1 UPF0262 family protein [Pseudomonas aeruginosa]MBH4002567.1 UPF0262 family protein [Pseudomonas aeruginosa]MBH9508852.1 UPF0262 family protein [Pseudomonas aeruginosa]MDI2538024.1 UPF0262 family protein [Pseudomonas aeruginosa]HDY5286378.1 UPF0262 family protein [Pseudomonas aeruginosa]